jgi:hypothetical protein
MDSQLDVRIKMIKSISSGGIKSLSKTKRYGLTISTIWISDLGYETAIFDMVGAHPVERCESKKEALVNHEKWVNKSNRLVTILKLGYPNSSIKDEEITLKRFQ